MKKKIQISYGANFQGEFVWTVSGNKVISFEDALRHWDSGSADWSIPAWQKMAKTLMDKHQEKPA